MESVCRSVFGCFRAWPFPTIYPAMPTPVTADVLLFGVGYGLLCMLTALILVLPGARRQERRNAALQVVFGMFILGVIILCNFGQEWEVASLVTRTQYKAGVRATIKARIQVKIGLRSINITLTGIPRRVKFADDTEETIDYNERFSWDNEGWTQGQLGFGPRAGKFNQEYRAAQARGLPYPILWVAEYFTLDGEGLRWGRFYRQAGYFTHILLWLALPLWFLAVVLFKMVISYGIAFCFLTGFDLLVACAVYSLTRNQVTLVIPFEGGVLEFHWGWCFWLCLTAGLVCIILGGLILGLDHWYADKVVGFFGKNVCDEAQEFYVSTVDLQDLDPSDNFESRLSPPPCYNSYWAHPDPRLGGDSTSVPCCDDGASLTDYDDGDTLVANEDYHQVFRKRTPSSLLLLKLTNKLRKSFPGRKRKPVIGHSDVTRAHVDSATNSPSSSSRNGGLVSNSCLLSSVSTLNTTTTPRLGLNTAATRWRMVSDKLLPGHNNSISQSPQPSCSHQRDDGKPDPKPATMQEWVNKAIDMEDETHAEDAPGETNGDIRSNLPQQKANVQIDSMTQQLQQGYRPKGNNQLARVDVDNNSLTNPI